MACPKQCTVSTHTLSAFGGRICVPERVGVDQTRSARQKQGECVTELSQPEGRETEVSSTILLVSDVQIVFDQRPLFQEHKYGLQKHLVYAC